MNVSKNINFLRFNYNIDPEQKLGRVKKMSLSLEVLSYIEQQIFSKE